MTSTPYITKRQLKRHKTEAARAWTMVNHLIAHLEEGVVQDVGTSGGFTRRFPNMIVLRWIREGTKTDFDTGESHVNETSYQSDPPAWEHYGVYNGWRNPLALHDPVSGNWYTARDAAGRAKYHSEILHHLYMRKLKLPSEPIVFPDTDHLKAVDIHGIPNYTIMRAQGVQPISMLSMVQWGIS